MSCNPAEVCRHDASQPLAPPNWRDLSLHRSDEIVPAIDGIVAEMEAAAYSRKEVFAVRLALEEAIVNAIKHGHHGDTTKRVHVRYSVTPSCLVAEVEDEGQGFRPEAVPDPLAAENLERDCGRGLLLMRNYMTWVRYNPAGTCVTLCKRRGA